jgi:hypothetical protein
LSEAVVAAGGPLPAIQWAFRGAILGAAGALFLVTRVYPGLIPTSPLVWNGIACLALCLLLVAEIVRRWWDRLSQGLVGAGGAALLMLGLFLALTLPAPEAGYPVLLAAAVYVFLRLGVDAGLLVTAVGLAAGVLLGGSDLGLYTISCLIFVFFSRSAPSRWQILGLLGIGAAFAALKDVLSFSHLAEVLLWLLTLVIAPWLLHFGAPRPWRWTWVAALLALRWLWMGTQAETSWPAGVALAGVAGLLCLAIPLARQLARDPESAAARMALEPLLGAAVVAVAFAVPLEMEPYRPWVGAALATPLLIWVDRRLKGSWLWLPTVGAAIAAVALFVKGGP